ncbi:serine racemase [Sarocladium strictum]
MADLSTCPPLTRDSVFAAQELIKDHVHRTPVLTKKTLNTLASTPRDPASLVGTEWEGRTPAKPVIRLYFKCENLQRIGAFKARGAFHAIERLKAQPGWFENEGKTKGVVTQSSGNHAAALALAARESGIPAHVVMPSVTLPNKVAATKGYGGKVYFSGTTAAERQEVAAKVQAETGATLVPPYDHPDIVLGQGTMGLELQEQAKDLIAPASTTSKGLDAIMTPCSGGGMLSGVALSCEGTGIRVFGAEPSFEGADDAKRGFESGKRIEHVKSMTVADGLRSVLGVYPWSIIYERKLVSGMYAVTEEEIIEATKLVLERMKLVVEPSAAVPLATVLFNEDFRAMVEQEAGDGGWDLGLVLSGGNIAVDGLASLFGKHK